MVIIIFIFVNNLSKNVDQLQNFVFRDFSLLKGEIGRSRLTSSTVIVKMLVRYISFAQLSVSIRQHPALETFGREHIGRSSIPPRCRHRCLPWCRAEGASWYGAELFQYTLAPNRTRPDGPRPHSTGKRDTRSRKYMIWSRYTSCIFQLTSHEYQQEAWRVRWPVHH
jgi:hypothetical protein